MARPGKSINEKIAALDEKIAKYTEKLLALKQERKALEGQQKEQDLTSLVQLMKEKGMTPAQLKDMISQPQEQPQEQQNWQ